MRDPIARGLGLALTAGYFAAIVWVYTHQPQTFVEATGALTATVGAYRVDQQAYADGLKFFHSGEFTAARLAFDRADPAHQDARTQFYIAYSYYRQGWGRFSDDKDLFARGIDVVNRAIAAAPRGRVVVDDPDLKLHSADELKAELEDELRSGARVNPLTVLRRQRK